MNDTLAVLAVLLAAQGVICASWALKRSEKAQYRLALEAKIVQYEIELENLRSLTPAEVFEFKKNGFDPLKLIIVDNIQLSKLRQKRAMI